MIKKWPIRLYDFGAELGIIDLSTIIRVGSIREYYASKDKYAFRYTIVCNVPFFNDGSKLQNDCLVSSTSKNDLEADREKLCGALVRYHCLTGLYDTIPPTPPEEQEQPQRDPIQSIDLSDTEQPSVNP